MLAEINSSALPNFRDADVMSVSSDDSGANFRSAAAKINDKLWIVSTQSTARPGAVVELEPIEDAKQVNKCRLINLKHRTKREYFKQSKFCFYDH